ncbi:glycosyltransferase [Vibrio alginolyticus]|uniref:glycosyltransferase n=1 Tax=Vibrio alginolyticus TaxID=663 RepID=UPI001047447F|nr:glycosyltransferase [Vibrio alginolyticus]EME0093446.1 glycosyltransferase [Vibrio parahaemolyticus]MCZ2800778.1 glycosyltransferase [Vibrio alginolyticus]TDE49420.1 glycosyltransferase [Vibrio alginolyticus]
MTKICFVIPSLGSGGAERVFSEIISHLDKDKYQVHLLLLLSKGIHYEKIKNENITVECLGGSRLLSINLIRRFVSYLSKHNFDVVMSTLMQLNLLISLFKPFYRKSNLIAREANIPSIYLSQKSYGKIFSFMYRHAMSQFDTIVCQSNNMRDDLINNFSIRNNLIVINNPAPITSLEKVHKKHQTNKFVVVSRLSKQKGIDRLIRMASRCNTSFEIDIFGEGEDKEYIETLIDEHKLESKIKLKGVHKDILSQLVHYDCFLLTSYFEGFPNALLEAQTVGLPGITFNISGGIDEIIDSQSMGFICNSEDEFIKAMSSFDVKYYNSYLIRERTNEKFGYYKIMRKYEDCIDGKII